MSASLYIKGTGDIECASCASFAKLSPLILLQMNAHGDNNTYRHLRCVYMITSITVIYLRTSKSDDQELYCTGHVMWLRFIARSSSFD